MFTRQFAMLIASMALMLSISCGGGGGGGPPPQQPPPPNTTALPITADNAQDITVGVLEAITSTVDLIDILDIVGLPTISAANSDPTKFLLRDIFTEIVPCDAGEATVTWDDADNNLMISTGDTFDVVFNSCFLANSGATLSGATSLTNLVITGDAINQIAPWRLATTFGFVNLSATDNAGPAILDGSLDLDVGTDDNVVVDLTLATASLTVQHSGITETLSDYVLAQTLDLNTLTQIISADGTLTSTLLEGTVTFETLQEFMAIGDDNPSAGQLLISDSTSSVLITALDNINVQLDVDIDLDGMIDATFVVTWTALDLD